MKVKFILTLQDVIVNGERSDTIIIDWVEDISPEEVLNRSNYWLTCKTSERLEGVTELGDACLEVEPLCSGGDDVR